jgi:hypothetical protein
VGSFDQSTKYEVITSVFRANGVTFAATILKETNDNV